MTLAKIMHEKTENINKERDTQKNRTLGIEEYNNFEKFTRRVHQ